jgi:hypothetical protein
MACQETTEFCLKKKKDKEAKTKAGHEKMEAAKVIVPEERETMVDVFEETLEEERPL